jgi:hypothetical protein
MQSTGQTPDLRQTPQSTHSSWSMTATSSCMLIAVMGQTARQASQAIQISGSILNLVSSFLFLP